MPAGHPDVVREQVARAVTAEEPVDLGQQFLHRTRLARHRLGPRHARQCFRPGGQIGRRIPVQHVQGAAIGTARLTWVAHTSAQPPAAPEPCADQSPGVLRGDQLESPVEGLVGVAEQAAERPDFGQLDQDLGIVGLDPHGLGKEAVRLRHRGDAAGVLRGGDEIGDGLLVLPGALEVAGDLGGPLAAMPGPGLLGALAEQLRKSAMQLNERRLGYFLVHGFGQQGVPEPGPPVVGPEQS